MTEPGARGPSASDSTMPALLERPKLSNAMARALHRHIMMERERKRQGELAPEREIRRMAKVSQLPQDYPTHGLTSVPTTLARVEEGEREQPLWGESEKAWSKFQKLGMGRTLESYCCDEKQPLPSAQVVG